MASYEPMIAHLFGIPPAQQYELTYAQWDRMRQFADAMRKG